MRINNAFLTAAIGCSLLLPSFVHAQKKKPKPAIVPAEKLAEGWDEIDERLVFLMVRLANVEASLDAVENAIGAGVRKKAVKSGDVKRAERGNELMDRKGGGPMKWSEFYGTTAEKFFYHPTDRNTTYHTETILFQKGPQADNKVGGGVPSSQGLPVHQRPPQFDYIYRANEKAKERAEQEATALKGKIEQLAQRRQRLEAEQAGLWCEIAFRAVSHYDLDKKPLYRFQPTAGSDTESRRNTDSMNDAASFMALALSIVDAAQKDQSTTFSKIKPAMAEARQRLSDEWLQLGVDVTDRYTTEGRFAALAKRLDDVASNLSDSYVVATEGDEAHDQERKDTFRALLQESLVKYAQIVLALDEMSTVMKNEWKITPDVKTPIQFVSLNNVVSTTRPLATGSNGNRANTTPGRQNDGTSLEGEWLTIYEEYNGDVYGPEKVAEINRRFVFKDDTLNVTRTFNGKFGRYDGHFHLTPATGRFDWSGTGPGGRPVKWIGIYELTGNRLKVCFKYVKDNTTDRPTTFKTEQRPGVEFVNLVLQKTVESVDGTRDTAPSSTARSGGDDEDAGNQSTAGDMKSLQGQWLCVAAEEIGEPADAATVKRWNRRYKFKGDSLTMERTKDGKYGKYDGKFEIDPSTGHFDWMGNGPEGAQVEWIGIYELDGDTLKLCYRYQKDGNAKRPSGFKTDVERPNISAFYTMKRVGE